jgi:hypothetical protein
MMKNSVIGFGLKMLGLFCIMVVLLWGAIELLGLYGFAAFAVSWGCGFVAGWITKGLEK